MKLIFYFIFFCMILNSFLYAKPVMNDVHLKSIYDLSFTSIDGKVIPFSKYKDKVIMIVNVASYCGFTYQYKQLEELYQTFNKDGFEIIAFPCNQFGNQEPNSNEQIKNFCEKKYKTTFQIADKIKVNGSDQHDIYKFFKILPDKKLNKSINWNFTKFLIDKNGNVIARYGSMKSPTSKDIKSLIANSLAIN